MWMMLMNVLMGLGVAAAIWSVWKIAKSYGKTIQWWHWLLLLVAVIMWIASFSWLGAGLGEELGSVVFVQAALFGWGVMLIVSVLIVLATLQLIRRQN